MNGMDSILGEVMATVRIYTRLLRCPKYYMYIPLLSLKVGPCGVVEVDAGTTPGTTDAFLVTNFDVMYERV